MTGEELSHGLNKDMKLLLQCVFCCIITGSQVEMQQRLKVHLHNKSIHGNISQACIDMPSQQCKMGSPE